MSVAVVGQNSFIARALKARSETADWRFIGWQQALRENSWLEGVDCLLNCAFDGALKSEPYSAAKDIDLRLGERLLEHPDMRYLMLSSRMVYGPAPAGGRLHEAMDVRPSGHYGVAKLQTERALAAMLGERLTVLRLSNICGYELEPARRSFLAMASRSLVNEGRIVLDMSPFVERDFLPVEVLAAWMPTIVAGLVPGVFNLGAGQGTPTGRIAQWLIEGHGSGQLLVSDLREHDGFWLDMARCRQTYGLDGMGQEALRDYCRSLGARLREQGRELA